MNRIDDNFITVSDFLADEADEADDPIFQSIAELLGYRLGFSVTWEKEKPSAKAES